MVVKNRLSHLRNKQGISPKRLAELVGVQRQTIYAMEAGTYVPNTLVALRLAQVLGVKVEDLFSLEEDVAAASATREVDLLPLESRLQPGQPLQLCQVSKHVVGVPAAPLSSYLPAADAVMVKGGGRTGRAVIQPFVVDREYGRRLLIAGCDPGISVLARHMKTAGIELVTASCSSSKALDLLKRKRIHVAGSHLRDEITGESNLPAIRKLFPVKSVTVVNFAVWEEGIVVAQGNPKQIRKVGDLARKDLRLINREIGAGSRLLLDATLRRLGCRAAQIDGYGRVAYGHIPAAWHVH